MLLAPHGAAAVHNNLGGEHARNSAFEACRRARAVFFRYEGEFAVRPGNVPQQGKCVQHGVVVVGDGIVITALERPHLRPAAVWVLRGKNVIKTAQKCRAIRLSLIGSGCGNDFRRKTQFSDRGVIIECANVVPMGIAGYVKVRLAKVTRVVVGGETFARSARVLRQVQIFAPASGRSLKRNHDVRDAPRLAFAIPGSGVVQRNASRRMTWRWNTKLLDAVLAHFRLKKSLIRSEEHTSEL